MPAQPRPVDYLTVIASAAALVISLVSLWLVVFNFSGDVANAEETARERGVLTCSMARLVAHVPALQFEGEPLDNFIGWIEARQDMLEATKVKDVCSAETQRLLEERAKSDQKLLDDLMNGPRS